LFGPAGVARADDEEHAIAREPDARTRAGTARTLGVKERC
jgi:hypothetical protein